MIIIHYLLELFLPEVLLLFYNNETDELLLRPGIAILFI